MQQNDNLEDLKRRFKYTQATPMMQQYLDIKFQNMDKLLLFRMGDFYELFFEDAKIASKLLGIALAKRGKHADEDLAMCGVPHHSIESYLRKLIDAGKVVAICEQTETPEEAKKRGYKAVVAREIVRIITPGTIIEESIIDSAKPNYLAAIAIDNKGNAAISFVDLATSYIATLRCSINDITSQLLNLDPREILLSSKWQDDERLRSLLVNYIDRVVFQVESHFALGKATATLKNFYKLQTLDSIGKLHELSITSLGAVIEYLITTQRHNLPILPLPYILNVDDYMFIDAATRYHLELTATTSGQYKGSLLSVINQCATKQGSRLLYQFLSTPLTDLDKINKRLAAVKWGVDNFALVSWIRAQLAEISDIERIIAKIAMNRAIPRDLLLLADTVSLVMEIKSVIHKPVMESGQILLQKIYDHLITFSSLYDLVTKAIKNDAPNNLSQGGYINPDFHPKLAELSELVNNTNLVIDKLRDKYRKITGIDLLKINRNNIIGYFIEVGSKHAAKMAGEEFIHRQSTQNAVRFTTAELQQLEIEIVTAQSQILALEEQIWLDICQQILAHNKDLLKLAKALSLFDLFTNFAYIAKEYDYVMPIMREDEQIIDITAGRHPVVEHFLKQTNVDFVANDCLLEDTRRIWLITGPNMAGKSTFLRQNALICVLAQIGCFVPAKAAEISVIDKLFSRIGAADDLSKGQSTFMVEMVETSAILNQATSKSFIILDEVGRGTSTYDGMAIAWAVLEFIHNDLECLSLFATHYHELTQLEKDLPALQNYNVRIEEIENKLIFLHKIIKGAADKSYGLHVAALAGLPSKVLQRAECILKELESTDYHHLHEQLPLQAASKAFEEKIIYVEKPSKLEDSITNINLNELSPKAALDLLYELRQQVIEK